MEETPPKLMQNPSDELYDRCNQVANGCKERFEKIFTQDELLKLCDTKQLSYIENSRTLLPIIQQLANSALFISLKIKGKQCWALRPRDAAKNVKRLSQDERIVYEVVEEAHNDGVWIRNIRNRTGIKDQKGLDKILRRLEQQHLVKQVKNIKSHAQKTFMLYHLAPSDEVTGGSFHDGGDLDETFVNAMSETIIFHVEQMGWAQAKRKRIKREREHTPIMIPDDDEQATAGAQAPRAHKRRKREPVPTTPSKDIEDLAPPRKHRSHKHTSDPETDAGPTQLSYPPDREYPNATSIYNWIVSTGILRGIKAESLTVDEIQTLINVLVWDEKLEEVNGGYRTVRGVRFKPPGHGREDDEAVPVEVQRGNALTEMPCGRCPAIDLCGTGGLVNASNCVYFEQWLDQAVAA